MAIVIQTETGEIYRLPEALALDEHELSIETPGVAIPRRHGEWRFDRFKQARPRRLVASGNIKNIDKAEAERIGADLRAKLAGAGVLRLRRSEYSDEWIFCEARELRHNYHPGRFRASLFTMHITFEALEPWWYMQRRNGSQGVRESGQSWQVDNPGTDQEQPALVRIVATEGVLVNPRVENQQTGSVALYAGRLEPGQLLELDAEARGAKLYTSGKLIPLFGVAKNEAANVWRHMNTGWQVDGFRLVPGANEIVYTDDESSSHRARVWVEFDPRSW